MDPRYFKSAIYLIGFSGLGFVLFQTCKPSQKSVDAQQTFRKQRAAEENFYKQEQLRQKQKNETK